VRNTAVLVVIPRGAVDAALSHNSQHLHTRLFVFFLSSAFPNFVSLVRLLLSFDSP
jgi:hypothetical protein